MSSHKSFHIILFASLGDGYNYNLASHFRETADTVRKVSAYKFPQPLSNTQPPTQLSHLKIAMGSYPDPSRFPVWGHELFPSSPAFRLLSQNHSYLTHPWSYFTERRKLCTQCPQPATSLLPCQGSCTTLVSMFIQCLPRPPQKWLWYSHWTTYGPSQLKSQSSPHVICWHMGPVGFFFISHIF